MRLLSSDYDLSESLARIDAFLNEDIKKSDAGDYIPVLTEIEQQGMFRTICTAVCIKIDIGGNNSNEVIKDSSKVLRAFVNEAIEILTSDSNCVDVSVVGFIIMAIYDTPFKASIEQIIDNLAMIHSLRDIINIKKMQNVESCDIYLKIGVHYGDVIMMQASHVNNSVSNIMWTGDAPNIALNLANDNNNERPIRITSKVFENLRQDYQAFFSVKKTLDTIPDIEYYDAAIVNTKMNKWVNTNKKTDYEQ